MPDAFIRVVGWTLLHSAWQGALVVLLSASVLALLPRATAGTR